MENFVYTEEVTGKIVQIPVKLLHHHHDNPRKDLGDLTELTESIKAKGVLQNLTVVPYWFKLTGVGCDDPKEQAKMGYLVVIGNRRLEAAKKAGLKSLPCIIAKMTPAEQVQTMLLENMQRNDLTAYEQAQGFQMMMDFGDTLEEVAEKTGFSKSTIKRRLEWAKLDGDSMKSVEGRQFTFADLDKLSQIDDIGTRNEVLCEIGTNNFDCKVQAAVKAQETEKKTKEWREALNARGAIEVGYSEIWDNGKYTYVEPGYFDIFGDIGASLKRLDENTQYYYGFNYGSVYLRKEKQVNETVDPAQEERNRREEERRATIDVLEEAFERAYDLRVHFAGALTEAAIKKKTEILIAAIIEKNWSRGYTRTEDETFTDVIGIVGDIEDYEDIEDVTKAYPYRSLLAYALYTLGDRADINCHNYYGQYTGNQGLERIYKLMTALGYEMSDEEKELLSGKSELYAVSEEKNED